MIAGTDQLAGTVLTAGQILPDVALTDAATGSVWRPSSLRQRAAQVLCFLHDDCEPCAGMLERLAERADDLAWMDTQVLAVLQRAADLPFPVVLDTDGRARARMLGGRDAGPAIVVSDRFTAAVAAYPVTEHAFPEPDEILTTLRLLACDCE